MWGACFRSQAWLLGVMRRGGHMNEILAIARKSEHRLVKMAYLIYWVEDEGDPMIDAARRDDDQKVRELADLLVHVMSRMDDEEAAADQAGPGR